MKRIGILTFHNALNYGAVLQCYALQETVKSFGVECEIIDYHCKKIVQNNNPNYIKDVPLYIKIYKWIYRRNHMFERYRLFEEFAQKYLNYSIAKYDRFNIKEANDKYDGFIAGSDQIWNGTITGDDTTFFLDFVENGKMKYSYAASFGNVDYSNMNIDKIKEMIGSFNAISCREEVEFLKFDEKNVRIDIDPVFLLDCVQWRNVASKCLGEKDYILVYMVQYDWELLRKSLMLQKETGLKVIFVYSHFSLKEISVVLKEKIFGLIRKDMISPEVFLELVDKAEIVITNSFHGTAFSLIFHKKLVVKQLNSKGEKNERIKALLKIVGIDSDRESLFFNVEGALDWSMIDSKIAERKKMSMQYLKSILVKNDNEI